MPDNVQLFISIIGAVFGLWCLFWCIKDWHYIGAKENFPLALGGLGISLYFIVQIVK